MATQAAAIGKKKKKRKNRKPFVVRRSSTTRTSNFFGDDGIGTGELLVAAVAGVGLGILAYQYLFKKTTAPNNGPVNPAPTGGTVPPTSLVLQSCRMDEVVERRVNGIGGCGCQNCGSGSKNYIGKFNIKNESF
jgi:hypothetical protein